MPETFDFAKALEHLHLGDRLTRCAWETPTEKLSVILVPGRMIKASFAPMANHLGDGTEFQVMDHIDAIIEYTGGDFPVCIVGYPFAQGDILATDWMLVA